MVDTLASRESQKSTECNSVNNALAALQKVRDIFTEHGIEILRISGINGETVEVNGRVYLGLDISVPVADAADRSDAS